MLMQNQNRLKILDLCFVRVGLHLLFDADKPKDGAWIKDAFLIVQFEVTLQSLCVCLFILFSKKIKQVIATLLSGFASGVLVLRHCYQMMQNLTTFFDSLHTKQSKNYYTHLMFSYKEKTRKGGDFFQETLRKVPGRKLRLYTMKFTKCVENGKFTSFSATNHNKVNKSQLGNHQKKCRNIRSTRPTSQTWQKNRFLFKITFMEEIEFDTKNFDYTRIPLRRYSKPWCCSECCYIS